MDVKPEYRTNILEVRLIMRLTIIFFYALLLSVPVVNFAQDAGLQLPAIFASGMVLQQEDTVTIRGRSGTYDNVLVEVGWDETTYKAVAGPEGNWSVRVATPAASFNPYRMVVTSNSETIILEDILIGDVWLVSGQSNMHVSFRGFINQPVNRAQEFLLQSNVNGIRLFKVEEGSSLVECDTIDGSWKYAKINNVIDFSAVGFVFGKTVYDYINIPIGLVQCTQNGSRAEAWLDKKSLREFGGFELDNIVIKSGLGTSRPTLQYNSMLNPLLPLRVKGVVWYQGEANVSQPEVYKNLFPFLIEKWREYFDHEDMPFYYVQIAPFSYDFAPGLESQYLREVQLNTMKRIENVGMAVTLDVGSKDKIHPPEKEIVGKRLAYWALNKTYGITSISCRGPEYKSMEIKEGKINLKFEYAPGGLSTFGKKLTGFEVAGSDQVYYKAKAMIETEKGWEGVVHVWSEKVPHPVAVRYGFTNYIDGSLYNTQGLPASSFRTDNW
jgi:sialate O-acetylesterase